MNPAASEFDAIHDRSAYGSAKWANRWDEYSSAIEGDGILSLWTADMDFRAPQPVIDRLVDAAQHGVYGYTLRDPAHFEIVRTWFAERHNWTPGLETLLPGSGVMPCVAAILRTFTEPGDGVIVQTPVYSPYFEVISGNQRRLLVNQLRLDGDRYRLDLENFEALARSGAKAFILCNPHNPSGYAWTFEELTALNRDYVASVQNSDVERFDHILAADFYCSNPDKSLVDRAAFLKQTAIPVTIKNLRAEDVKIRVLGDFAIIHAATSYTTSDGQQAHGRYTDCWAKQNGRWLAVSAHVSR